jgi:hypothetical protein
MHELQFASSAVPNPASVLGLELAPYSLGHEIILLARRSPFLCLSRDEFIGLPGPQQIFALTFALGVCTANRPRWWLWRWLNRKPNWPLAIAEFRNYLEAARTTLPALNANDKLDADAFDIANGAEEFGAGRSLGAPLHAQLIHYAIADLRLSHEDALASPYNYLANLYLAHLEAKGQIYIENYKEAQAKAELLEHRATVSAEETAAKAAWAAAGTDETARRAAYAAHPRIGNLFAADWYAAGENDEARSAVVEQWGFVAETELAKAGITMKEKTSCPD